jgi:histidyl-tRNA synthetase
MPATGVTGGFERLMLSLERKGLFPDTDQNIQAFVAMAGAEVRKETMAVLETLRQAGIRADRDLKERPLRKQMEYHTGICAPCNRPDGSGSRSLEML